MFFFVTSAYAGTADCAIKNGMSPELVTYIKTTEDLLSKIEGEAAKKSCAVNANGENGASASVNKTMSAVIGSMNESIGFSNFYTSGRFYIDIALKTELPAGITRDHERLGKELERIKNTTETVYSRCAEGVVPIANLSDDPAYGTSGKSLGAILKEVLKNQVDMMNFYRETVLGDKPDEWYEFKLVGNSKDFVSKLQASYGPAAFNECNAKSAFFESIRSSFDRITKLGEGIGKGMQDWRDASRLLGSNSSDAEYAETEQNVLRNEMSRQGMSSKGSQIIMNNLAIYNSQDASEGLSGFISSVGERAQKTVAQFADTFKGMADMIRNAKTTDTYMEATQSLIILKNDINDDIIKDYVNAKNLM